MKKFLREGQDGKVFEYQPIGSAYSLEGEQVMDCHVHEYTGGGPGYGRYVGEATMTLRSIRNEDGLHV